MMDEDFKEQVPGTDSLWTPDVSQALGRGEERHPSNLEELKSSATHEAREETSAEGPGLLVLAIK